MTDSIFQILAIFGALAWLSPLVIPWIKRKIVKSKIAILTDKILEIGYTNYGPILNINFSILVKDKNALIEKINLGLQHENQETHSFSWEWFEEQILQMDVPDYGSMPFKKNQKAVAINAITNILVEKKIGFQSPDFQKKYIDLLLATNETFSNLTKARRCSVASRA